MLRPASLCAGIKQEESGGVVSFPPTVKAPSAPTTGRNASKSNGEYSVMARSKGYSLTIDDGEEEEENGSHVASDDIDNEEE